MRRTGLAAARAAAVVLGALAVGSGAQAHGPDVAFKVPMLRGLAARAPYFHDSTADHREAFVDCHDDRFGIGLTLAGRGDLVASLRAL